MATVYGVGGVLIDTTTVEGITIAGIQDGTLDKGIQAMLVRGDTDLGPQWVSEDAQRPTLNFRSTDVATMLTNIGVKGIAIDTGSGDTGLTAYLAKKDRTGYATGSVHKNLVIAAGVLYPVDLVIPGQGPVTMSAECQASHDGSNNIVVLNSNVALPATLGAAQAWKRNYISVNGTEVPWVVDARIGFGHQSDVVYGDANLPEWASIEQSEPFLQFSCRDMDVLATLGLDAVNVTSNVLVYLAKAAPGARFSASADSKKLTIEAGMFHFRTLNLGRQTMAVGYAQIRKSTNDFIQIADSALP